MKIYFSCSITGGRNDQEIYRQLVKFLIDSGHDVPTAHLADPDVMQEESVITPQMVYERDMMWIEKCDALVAEVSTPSHGVGYEIARAIILEKPVFICYQKGCKVSKIILGNTYGKFYLCAYANINELTDSILSFLEKFNGK
ncbi:MAG TPA: deoxyribonucleoside 5'-monophosphate N-glycosidase [Anaerolineae bacterium]|nr:deoxyribonucleoside 5'-monophosphate N-glycosidase [Anaerolineae bacterium]